MLDRLEVRTAFHFLCPGTGKRDGKEVTKAPTVVVVYNTGATQVYCTSKIGNDCDLSRNLLCSYKK